MSSFILAKFRVFIRRPLSYAHQYHSVICVCKALPLVGFSCRYFPLVRGIFLLAQRALSFSLTHPSWEPEFFWRTSLDNHVYRWSSKGILLPKWTVFLLHLSWQPPGIYLGKYLCLFVCFMFLSHMGFYQVHRPHIRMRQRALFLAYLSISAPLILVSPGERPGQRGSRDSKTCSLGYFLFVSVS